MGFKLLKGDTSKTQGIFCRIFPIFLREKKLPRFEGQSFVSGMDVFVDFLLGYSWT
jgi:hypothetical protein